MFFNFVVQEKSTTTPASFVSLQTTFLEEKTEQGTFDRAFFGQNCST